MRFFFFKSALMTLSFSRSKKMNIHLFKIWNPYHNIIKALNLIVHADRRCVLRHVVLLLHDFI